MLPVFPSEIPGHVRVVRHEQTHGLQVGDDVIERSVRHGDAVVRAGSPPELVQNHERLFRRRAQNGGTLGHLLEKRGRSHREVVARAHAGVHAVEHGELRDGSRNVRAHLRHEREQRRLPYEAGLAAHVGTGDDERANRVVAQIHRVGDEGAGIEDSLQRGVPPVHESNRRRVAIRQKRRLDVPVQSSHGRE